MGYAMKDITEMYISLYFILLIVSLAVKLYTVISLTDKAKQLDFIALCVCFKLFLELFIDLFFAEKTKRHCQRQ